MRYPTFDEIRGPVERVLYIGVGWLVARDYISTGEAAGYVTLLLGVIAAFYGWWQNRPQGIVVSAAALGLTQKELTEAVSAAKKPLQDEGKDK